MFCTTLTLIYAPNLYQGSQWFYNYMVIYYPNTEGNANNRDSTANFERSSRAWTGVDQADPRHVLWSWENSESRLFTLQGQGSDLNFGLAHSAASYSSYFKSLFLSRYQAAIQVLSRFVPTSTEVTNTSERIKYYTPFGLRRRVPTFTPSEIVHVTSYFG